jgi:HK97 family phage portal protein
MAWNQPQAKQIQPVQSKAAQIPVGAPVALNPSMTGRAYRDGWDIERAYREGMQKVVWVYRCIDAIAGNQARLPVILREDNAYDGKIVTKSSASEVIDLLNSKANQGENSFVFRHRMSSQLLMSTRGVFIEKVRGRDGSLVALHLLPPQHTAPIPDARTFVAGYEVSLPNGGKKVLRPDDVLWIRRPHPLDPYRSITPMESAGVAIEIENLAKLYNRNFLINDGRPGGLLVVRGEIDDDDKEELRSRFRGNINRAGAVSVISSDDGVDFVDTGASPRDAAYMEMRNLTKEEILSAFGVPETAIGNAAGRTFSNASEEMRVFWMETMLPHLQTLARGLDELDEKYYVDFDTDSVPIIILYKQERERYLMNEFQAGLISGNEYRIGIGRKVIKSELMDSLLANPNLTPIGNTEKKMDMASQGQPVDQAGVPGAPTPAPLPNEAAAQAAAAAGGEAPVVPTEEPAPEQQASLNTGPMSYKNAVNENKLLDEDDVKAEQSVDRWTEIMDRSLERLFERQQRVVLEKAGGAKTRKAIESGNLSVDSIFDVDVWNKQMEDDLKPVIAAIVKDATDNTSMPFGAPSRVSEEDIKAYADEQIQRMQKANDTTREEISAAILTALALRQNNDEGQPLLKAALIAIFMHLLAKRKRAIAEHEAQSAYNAGVWFTANTLPVRGKKTWVTRRDDSVRSEHRFLHGKSVPIKSGFMVGDEVLRFPGDPLAPPHLTIGCRCRLKFGS